MQKIGASLLLAVLLITQAEALLPPLYQTSAEIRDIMTSAQLGQKLQAGEVIEKIQKNEQGYEVMTNKNHLYIHVIYETHERPSPAPYILYFEDPIPRTIP